MCRCVACCVFEVKNCEKQNPSDLEEWFSIGLGETERWHVSHSFIGIGCLKGGGGWSWIVKRKKRLCKQEALIAFLLCSLQKKNTFLFY